MVSTFNEYKLLQVFRGLFDGVRYLHRKSTLGDSVAVELYEDLARLRKSAKIVERVQSRDRVANLKNVAIGRSARRGDGTFGELVPAAIAYTEKGFIVGRGPVANIEIGAETKILSKAMIKQIDRVISDLISQAGHFRRTGGNPICVGIIGINHADTYLSHEGTREFPTDGRKYKHPFQEAPEAERRLLEKAKPEFDEFLVLKFKATNVEPYPFEWINYNQTCLEYAAVLTRISREYDRRFP